MIFTFTPPTAPGFRDGEEHLAERGWYAFNRRIGVAERGLDVWKDSSGTWHEGSATNDDQQDATYLYQGGRVHEVSSAEKTELEAQGYTVVTV